MKREIKFKAKRVDNGEWVEGDLLHKYWIRGDEFIETAIRYLIGNYYSFPIPVNPETVCQFTGAIDYIGNEVWENSVIQNCDTLELQVVYWSNDKSAWYCKYLYSDRIVSLSDSLGNLNLVIDDQTPSDHEN